MGSQELDKVGGGGCSDSNRDGLPIATGVKAEPADTGASGLVSL